MSKTLEELGYEKVENEYYVEFQNMGEAIIFDKDNKEFSGQSFSPSGEFREFYDKTFTMEELKAIYKWCEDNKWI